MLCSICNEVPVCATHTNCKHTYCKACIVKWTSERSNVRALPAARCASNSPRAPQACPNCQGRITTLTYIEAGVSQELPVAPLERRGATLPTEAEVLTPELLRGLRREMEFTLRRQRALLRDARRVGFLNPLGWRARAFSADEETRKAAAVAGLTACVAAGAATAVEALPAVPRNRAEEVAHMEAEHQHLFSLFADLNAATTRRGACFIHRVNAMNGAGASARDTDTARRVFDAMTAAIDADYRAIECIVADPLYMPALLSPDESERVAVYNAAVIARQALAVHSASVDAHGEYPPSVRIGVSTRCAWAASREAADVAIEARCSGTRADTRSALIAARAAAARHANAATLRVAANARLQADKVVIYAALKISYAGEPEAAEPEAEPEAAEPEAAEPEAAQPEAAEPEAAPRSRKRKRGLEPAP